MVNLCFLIEKNPVELFSFSNVLSPGKTEGFVGVGVGATGPQASRRSFLLSGLSPTDECPEILEILGRVFFFLMTPNFLQVHNCDITSLGSWKAIGQRLL